MFGQDRTQLRAYYQRSWQLAQQGQPLDALQQQLVQVLREHPEYHVQVLSEDALSSDWLPEMGTTNPFLHMGMHLALREQVATNRPDGITTLYHQLCQQQGDSHEAEHLMMDCLGEALWQSQRYGQMPDERAYLNCLRSRCLDLPPIAD